MRVIRCGKKAKPSKEMDDAATLNGFWRLEQQLGIREIPTPEILLNIPQLNPVPLTIEEMENET